MLRIHQATTDKGTIISLEGKLLAPWANEVRIAAASALAHGSVMLNLEGLSFADNVGIATLRSLRLAGVGFERSSPFIDSLLALTEQHS